MEKGDPGRTVSAPVVRSTLPPTMVFAGVRGGEGGTQRRTGVQAGSVASKKSEDNEVGNGDPATGLRDPVAESTANTEISEKRSLVKTNFPKGSTTAPKGPSLPENGEPDTVLKLPLLPSMANTPTPYRFGNVDPSGSARNKNSPPDRWPGRPARPQALENPSAREAVIHQESSHRLWHLSKICRWRYPERRSKAEASLRGP